MPYKGVVALIPAYQPDDILIDIVEGLAVQGFPVVVVNDGSAAACESVFVRLTEMATVLTHPKNRGKGRALKTGFEHIHRHFPQCVGVVAIDADGQHIIEDVLEVAKALEKQPTALILGVRSFGKTTPWTSRLGNEISRCCINFLWGLSLEDSQTGLRGVPREALTLLQRVAGERYEFETWMLHWAVCNKRPIVQIPIQTIYFPGNPSSHFAPLSDSCRFTGALLRMILDRISIRWKR